MRCQIKCSPSPRPEYTLVTNWILTLDSWHPTANSTIHINIPAVCFLRSHSVKIFLFLMFPHLYLCCTHFVNRSSFWNWISFQRFSSALRRPGLVLWWSVIRLDNYSYLRESEGRHDIMTHTTQSTSALLIKLTVQLRRLEALCPEIGDSGVIWRGRLRVCVGCRTKDLSSNYNVIKHLNYISPKQS